MNRMVVRRLTSFFTQHEIVFIVMLIIGSFFVVTTASAAALPEDWAVQLCQLVDPTGIGDVVCDANVRIPMSYEKNPILEIAGEVMPKDSPVYPDGVVYDCDENPETNPEAHGCDLWATVIYHQSIDEETSTIKKLPTIFVATGYRRDIMTIMRVLNFVQYGYNVVAIDMRGSGSGAGIWDVLSPIEAYDTKYMIDDWIPSQPWSDGTVGMVGGSYEAILQYLAAGLVDVEDCGSDQKGDCAPVHLKAISPLSAFSDVYKDVAFNGGNFEMDFMTVWIAATDMASVLPPAALWDYLTPGGIDPDELQAGLEIWKEHLAQARLPIDWVIDPEHELKCDWYDLKNPKMFWPQKPADGWNFDVEGLPRAFGENVISQKLPVFTTTGWFDIFTRGSLNNYQYGLANHLPSDKFLIIGPWYHIDAAYTLPGVFGMGILGKKVAPPMYGIFGWEVLLRWFDWKLKGKNDPYMEKFPVALYVMGEDRWRAEQSWPLPESRVEDKTYYFSKKYASAISGDWFSASNALNNYKMVSSTSDEDYYNYFLGFKLAKANPVLDHNPAILHGLTSRSTQRWLGFSPLTVIPQELKLDFGMNVPDELLPWEDERFDEVGVLTFTTEPLEQDLEISGALKLTFWAKTEFDNHPLSDANWQAIFDKLRDKFDIEGKENAVINFGEKKDVQWVIEVNDVFPNGRARNITSGWLSAAHRPYDPDDPTKVDPAYVAFDPFYDYSDKNPDPISENAIYQYVVEVWPTTNVFKAGHRIRLSISASDFPHLFPVLKSSKNTIVLNESHKARLDFKVANKKDEGVTWKWIDQTITNYLLTGKE